MQTLNKKDRLLPEHLDAVVLQTLPARQIKEQLEFWQLHGQEYINIWQRQKPELASMMERAMITALAKFYSRNLQVQYKNEIEPVEITTERKMVYDLLEQIKKLTQNPNLAHLIVKEFDYNYFLPSSYREFKDWLMQTCVEKLPANQQRDIMQQLAWIEYKLQKKWQAQLDKTFHGNISGNSTYFTYQAI